MTDRTTLSYPEFKPRPWALATPWSLGQIETFLRQGLSSAAHHPRHRAYKAVIEAVHQLAHRGVTEFRGDKVHRLLVVAAHTHGWMAPTGGYKAVPKSEDPEVKYCRRCREAKQLSEFRAVATPEQKRRNGWNPDAQYLTVSLLCGVCRAAKKRMTKRKAGKREAPTLVAAYKASITNDLETVAKVLKRHSTALSDGTVMYNFTDDNDQAYYFERQALLRAMRERLNLCIEEGTLKDFIPAEPRCLWFELLTEGERDELARLHRAGSWWSDSGKRKMPLLWAKEGKAAKRAPAPVLRIKADSQTQTAPPAELLLNQPKTQFNWDDL